MTSERETYTLQSWENRSAYHTRIERTHKPSGPFPQNSHCNPNPSVSALRDSVPYIPMTVPRHFILPVNFPPTSLTSQDPHSFPIHSCSLMFPHQHTYRESKIRPLEKVFKGFFIIIISLKMNPCTLLRSLTESPLLQLLSLLRKPGHLQSHQSHPLDQPGELPLHLSCWGTQAPQWAAEPLHHSWQSITLLWLASGSQMGFELALNRSKTETYPTHKLICLQMCQSFHAQKADLKQPSSIFTIGFPFNFAFGCTRSVFLLPAYSLIESSLPWAQYFYLLHRSSFLLKRSASLTTISLSESDYMYLMTKDTEFTFYPSLQLHVVVLTRATCISDVYEQIPERKLIHFIGKFFPYTNWGIYEKQNNSFLSRHLKAIKALNYLCSC